MLMDVREWNSRAVQNANLTVTFSEAIESINSNFITLHERDINGFDMPASLAADIQFTDNTVVVNPANDLRPGREYSIKFSQGAVRSRTGDTFPSGTITSSSYVVNVLAGDTPAAFPPQEFTPAPNPTFAPAPPPTPPIIPTPPPTSVTYSISDLSLNEGSSKSVIITRAGDISAFQTVTITSNDGSAQSGLDYGPININLTFRPGESTKDIQVTSLNDALIEKAETFELIGGSITGGPSTLNSSWLKGTGAVSIVDTTVAEPLKPKPTADQSKPPVNTGSPTPSDEDEKIIRTLNFEVEEYLVGTSNPDLLTPTGPNRFKSHALWGESGADTLTGGTKDDYLIGGLGNDILTGGKGSDLYVMSDSSNRFHDLITDFTPKDDAIGIATSLIEASSEDTVALVTYKDIKTKSAATKFFKSKAADQYVIIDTPENIKKISSKTIGKKIQLAIDVNNKTLAYDHDGIWSKGNDVLCKFTNKILPSTWSKDNFSFGVDLAFN